MADTKISALPASTTPLTGAEVVPVVQSGTTKQVSVANLTAGRAVATGALTASGNVRTEYSAAGNVSLVANNTASSAGAASQIIAVNNVSRGLRVQYSSSGGAGGSALTNGITTETAQIFTDNNYPIVIGTNVSAAAIIDTSQNVKLINNLIIGTSGKGIDFSATSGTGTSELLADYEEGTWTPTQGPGLVVVGSFTSNGTYTKVGRFVFVRGLLIGSTSIAANANGFFCGGLPFTVDIEPAQAINDTATGAAQMQASVTNIYNIQAIPAASRIVFNATFIV